MSDTIRLEKIILELEKAGVVRLRGEMTDYKKGEDMDLYLPQECVDAVKKILAGYNFSLVHENASKIFYKYSLGENIVILDFLKNFDYIFDLFPGISLKQEYIEKYIQDPKVHAKSFACIRYIHMLRSDKKALSFLGTNFTSFLQEEFHTDALTSSIFKDVHTISKAGLQGLLKKSIFSLFSFVKLRYIFSLPYGYYKKYRVHLHTGRVVCLSGVDGVGKTTICTILEKMYKGKYIYMGYGDTPSLFEIILITGLQERKVSLRGSML